MRLPHSPQRALAAPLLLLAALAAGPGCTDDPGLQGGCVDDAWCLREVGPGWECSDLFSPRICVCTGDQSCGPNEFCNEAGACQALVGCVTNDDCADDLFCNRETERCMQKQRCTNDLHCPIGSLCDTLTYRCEPGCRVSGDCPLGMVCRPDPSDPGGSKNLCELGPCDDDSFCDLVQICEYDAAAGDSFCVDDDRGPYCRECQFTPGGAVGGYCDQPGNYCLMDTSGPLLPGFCGVDCGADQPCPNGFSCHHVVILTQSTCGRDSDCRPTGATCAADDDCPGGRCAIPQGETLGQCAGRCVRHEGAAFGFCSCVEDFDCPQDTCDSTSLSCGLTRSPCQTGGGQCKGQLSCVNLNGIGGCVIGKNCAPSEGITCTEVRMQP